jgi:signal transduction histidine kinase
MTMMTTIAHGIKTPVANIKLYADAISTGLYQPDGKVNGKDAEVAAKISKNADDVAELVKELIDKASGGIVDFEPDIGSFYLNELEEFLKEEFGNRLEMLRIPLKIETGHNAIVKSDKSGICRILSQLMENAVKYGNGDGISVNLDKESDGFYIIVRNKGEIPDESELPYLFNSFWRGSNASDIPGSGIGLFEAREIARKLYGDIYVKADPANKEREFDVYIP